MTRTIGGEVVLGIAAIGGTTVLGVGALAYLLIGGIGALTNNKYNSVSLETLEGNKISYAQRPHVNSIWAKFPFPFVDRDGVAVMTIGTPEGGLVKIIDENNDGLINTEKDVIEVTEVVQGIRGKVKYYADKVIDGDNKTVKNPSIVMQAKILEESNRTRAKWQAYFQAVIPEIKARLQQQQDYRNKRR